MKRASILLFAITLCACALEGPKTKAETANVPQGKEAAELASALEQLKATKSEYRISGSDLIEITVYLQPELDRKVRVSQGGTITFPLIGIVRLGGLSIIEAQDTLSNRLKEFLVSPQVTIFIREYGNKKIFILGEVAKPGSYELPAEARLTALEAITLAGGFTPIAAPDRTKIIRQVNGQNQSIPVEFSAITKRGEKDKDFPLEPNDVIYVPQSYF